MGYVNDPDVFVHIGPNKIHYAGGTWTEGAGTVTDTISIFHTATDEESIVSVPIVAPASKKENKGVYLKSINLWYIITIEAMDAVTAALNLVTMGADGAAPTVESIPFTYDSGHDLAAERIDIDEHKMTLTLDTPIYLDDAEQFLAQLTIDSGANGTFRMCGAQANFTYKM